MEIKNPIKYRLYYISQKIVPYWKVITTILAILILYFLYSKGIIAIAFVNGEPITIKDAFRIIKSGEPSDYINTIIFEKMIEIEGRRRNIIVTTKEIENEISNISEQAQANGKTILQILRESNQTMEDLQRNVKIRITLYKIISQDIDVTDEEIDQFVDENSELYENGEDKIIRDQVKKILTGAKTSSYMDNYIKNVKANTEIKYFIK